MTNQLRKLAEAEAKNEFHPDRQPFNLYDARRSGYVRGFIAGRTSVTHADIERVILGRTATAGARAVLALLSGETDE